jgi:5-hydroxyisourate hydrolase
MSAITTHVLDTSRGCPAAGVEVELEQLDARDSWTPIARGVTDADGRLRTLVPAGVRPVPGTYRLVFATAGYFGADGRDSFFPRVVVIFKVGDAPHYHVPLLLSPFGYSTYRGT